MELISSALRDQSEAEFVGRRDAQNNPLPSSFEPLNRQFSSSGLPFDPLQSPDPLGDMPMTPALRDWTRRNVLSAGSLLGKSCQGALLLAGHGEQLQKQGFLFGKHLSLAWQVKYGVLVPKTLVREMKNLIFKHFPKIRRKTNAEMLVENKNGTWQASNVIL